MRQLALLAMVALTITCGPSPDAKLPGYAMVVGGSNPPAGGTTDTGGTTAVGTGGIVGTGGSSVVGTGGRVGPGGSGGKSGTGGGPATGGRVGADGGPGGTTGTGGHVGTGGGGPGVGGSGSGGAKLDAGRGGNDGGFGRGGSGTGGSATGGTTGKNDASIASPDSAGNCMSQVVSNDYACGSAPACSACIVNGTSQALGCQKGVDCLAGASSCDSNCQLKCLNSAGDAQIQKCVTALQTAACGATGCGSTPPPNGGG